MHGNTAGPRALLEAASIALQTAPVSVGLEAPERDTKTFEVFLASEGTAEDRDALLKAQFWSPSFFDGRASTALFDTMEELRRCRQDGRDVRVFGFVRAGEHDPANQNGHEQRMANVIVEHAHEHEQRKIVALVGNLHAQTTAFRFGVRAETTPMASRVMAQVVSTLTVKLVYDGGATWALSGGLQRMELAPDVARLEEFCLDASGKFHALWPVGPGIPSPPANPAYVLPNG